MKRYIFIGLLILSSFTKSNQFINGVDISMLKQVEENGGLFYENGNQIDPIQIFKDKQESSSCYDYHYFGTRIKVKNNGNNSILKSTARKTKAS